jgi:hypothetical protein
MWFPCRNFVDIESITLRPSLLSTDFQTHSGDATSKILIPIPSQSHENLPSIRVEYFIGEMQHVKLIQRIK